MDLQATARPVSMVLASNSRGLGRRFEYLRSTGTFIGQVLGLPLPKNMKGGTHRAQVTEMRMAFETYHVIASMCFLSWTGAGRARSCV